MSFRNLLDLRKKTQQQTQIIEHVVFQKRSVKSDLFLSLSVIFVASTIIWGVSKADNMNSFVKSQTKNFSASGIVLSVNEVNLYIDQAKGSDDAGKTSYAFNLLDSPKIETDQYVPISVSDIALGAKVVVQGKIDGGNITVKRIIYFGIVTPKEVTATSTLDIATSTASTTLPVEEVPSTTVGTSTDSDSGTSFVDKIKDVVTDVIDSLIGSPATTSSSTPDIATSTPNEQATSTTEEVSTSSDSTVGTSTSIIETISNAIDQTIDNAESVINNVVDTVIEIVTGDTESQTPSIETELTNTSTGTE